MRQSVDQLYASLRNDQIAKEKQALTAFDEANGRQYLASIGYDVEEFERAMRSLKANGKRLAESAHAMQAPGQRFGGLGGNRVLNDQYYSN